MKALAFVATITITIGLASTSFTQICGILKSEADTYNSFTWKTLIGAFIKRTPNPDHWQEKEADFYILDKAKAVYWDGKNSNGENVASDVYFYTLQTDDYSQTQQMVILK